MTIKEFASLCGCNTQTLRYYDKIDLLKPVKVDLWSGYRYYEKRQAIAFVKIKNLQAADFTIEEIKKLLELSDQQVYEAFEEKIDQQTQRLERMKEIQRSYLTEKNNMEKLVQNLSDYLLDAIRDYEILREFGMAPENGPDLVEKLRAYIAQKTLQHLSKEPEVTMVLNDKVIRGAENVAEAISTLRGKGYEDTVLLGDETVGNEEDMTPENSEIIWECHDWSFVYEFLDQIPKMKDGRNYCFWFHLVEEKYAMGMEFAMFMISTMLPRTDGEDITMGCSIKRSEDGTNHFLLLRRK